MEKERFVLELNKNGYEAVEENGVVFVLYKKSSKLDNNVFQNVKKVARENGYVNSLGIKCKREEKE